MLDNKIIFSNEDHLSFDVNMRIVDAIFDRVAMFGYFYYLKNRDLNMTKYYK